MTLISKSRLIHVKSQILLYITFAQLFSSFHPSFLPFSNPSLPSFLIPSYPLPLSLIPFPLSSFILNNSLSAFLLHPQQLPFSSIFPLLHPCLISLPIFFPSLLRASLSSYLHCLWPLFFSSILHSILPSLLAFFFFNPFFLPCLVTFMITIIEANDLQPIS